MSHHVDTLSDAVHEAFELVADDGPISVDEALRHLADSGYSPDPVGLIDELADEHRVRWIADHLLLPEQVLEGVVLTHRVTDVEIARGYIDADPDLHLLLLDCSPAFESNRGELKLSYATNEPRLVGPAGWLDDLEPGDLVAVSWRTTGMLAVAAADPAALGDGSRQTDVMRAAFASVCAEGDTTEFIDVLFGAWQRDPALFATLQPPAGELAAAAGLSVRGDEVGDASIDWDAVDARRMARYADQLADEYELDAVSAARLATLAVSSLWDDASQSAVDVDACTTALRDPFATDAFLERKTDRDPAAIARLRLLVARVEAAHDDCAGAALVSARCAELEGDALAHARHVDRALRIDHGFWPARAERAWIRADAGNARGARGDLVVCGDEPPGFDALAVFSGHGPVRGTRNEPCPCGSGVKHKLCCGPHKGFPLALRAMWLYAKALWFAWRPGQRSDVKAMLRDVAGSLDVTHPGLVAANLDAFVEDPLVLDAALFGGGLITRFRVERRLLLPHDEVALLDEWSSARPGLYRVDGWRDKYHAELVDFVTGERVYAAAPAPRLEIGQIIACCLLSDGSEPALLGWNSVRADAVDTVRDGLRAGDTLAVMRAQIASRVDAAEQAIARIDPAMRDERAWLFPHTTAEQRSTLPVGELVALEYPKSAAAAERGDDEVDVDGMQIHPRLHLGVHCAVAEQILQDRPKQMWSAALRLSAEGFPRDDILHMLFATVLLWLRDVDHAAGWDYGPQIEMLEALPRSFYDARAARAARKAARN